MDYNTVTVAPYNTGQILLIKLSTLTQHTLQFKNALIPKKYHICIVFEIRSYVQIWIPWNWGRACDVSLITQSITWEQLFTSIKYCNRMCPNPVNIVAVVSAAGGTNGRLFGFLPVHWTLTEVTFLSLRHSLPTNWNHNSSTVIPNIYWSCLLAFCAHKHLT